jgi:hypothetical protein
MIDARGDVWTTDEDLFAGLPGGRDVIDWFGQVPSFHDATLERVEVQDGSASIAIRAFRATTDVGPDGFYILDKHAVVTFQFIGVTGISIVGDARAIVLEIGIRGVTSDEPGWETCAGPRSGDIEVRFDSSYGLAGAIFAREVRLQLTPKKGCSEPSFRGF